MGRDFLVRTTGDKRAVAGALAHERAVHARQHFVVLLLEARDALVVDVHDAEHLGGEAAVGIHALDRRLEFDARDALLSKKLRILLIDLALDVHEGALAIDEVLDHVLIHAQHVDEGVDRTTALLLFDERRVQIDILAFDARHQHRTVAVVDRAALRIEGLTRHPTSICLLAIPIGIEDLYLGKACENDRRGGEEAAGQQAMTGDELC